MASGIITGYTSNQYIDVKIEWSSTISKTNDNHSDVYAALYYKRNNKGFTTSGTGTFSLYIGTASKTETQYLAITGDAWIKVMEYSALVPHSADGTASVTIRATGSIPVTSLTYTTCGASVKLDTIPRASSITSALDKSLGEACSVTWTPQSSGFTYKLNFSLGAWSHTTGLIKPNQNTSYTYTEYTLPLEVANQLPNSTKGTMTVILATYSDSEGKTQVGSNASKTFTVTVPNDERTQPTVSSMSLSPNNILPSNASPSLYNSLYIQGFSSVKASLEFGAKYGATVVASSITVEGTSYSYPYESGILSQPGTVSVKATVKDSRGYYGTNYKDIEVIPYSKPYVRAKSGESSIIAARCDASANFTDSGTYLKIKAKVVYSKMISGGVQHNYSYIKFRYRKEGGAYSSWQTILDCKANNSDEVITPPLLNGTLDIKYNYQVQIIATDDFGSNSDPITIALASDDVYMDRPAGGKSMGLGGYSSGDGNLDVYWKTKARGGLSLFNSKGEEIPLGTTMPLPRDQIKGEWNANSLDNGVHIVANNNALKSGESVIMYNGVLIQMNGDINGNVKLQLALPVDSNRNPMYRLCWYSNWSDWRSLKI